MKGAGPIEIQGKHISSKIAKAQNKTASHVWKQIRESRAFYIADSVGAGKSFISLAVAFGKWRLLKQKNQKIFRLLIIAPTPELCHSWLGKLGGKYQNSKDSIGNMAITPHENSFFDLYLPEFKKDPPEIAIYQFRGKYDASNLMSELDSKPNPALTPNNKTRKFRIEILVTTPQWLVKGRLGGKKSSRCREALRWLEWLQAVDCIIADEVFTAKKADTVYGEILRPNTNNSRFNIWNIQGQRPWLLGLSATLLSRDITDAWSLFELAWAWKDKKYEFNNSDQKAYGSLQIDLENFQKSLKDGLACDPQKMRQFSKDYKKKKHELEKTLRKIIVRTQPAHQRSYEFCSAGLTKLNRATPSSTFPISGGLAPVFSKLQKIDESDQKAVQNLAVFMKAALLRQKAFDKNNKTDPDTWTQVTETGGSTHGPKHVSFREWLLKHYEDSEHKWLQTELSEEFQFKVLVYVKHIRTAGAFRHRGSRKKMTETFGKDLHLELRSRMRETCHKLAFKNRVLFDGGKLENPNQSLLEVFEELGIKEPVMDTLKKPEYLTLLLAALVNAHKVKEKAEKLKKVRETMEGQFSDTGKNLYLRLLTRFSDIRKEILEDLELESLIEFDHRSESMQKKYPSLSLMVLDVDFGLLEEAQKIEIARKLNHLSKVIFSIVGVQPGKMKLKKAQKEIGEFKALLVQQVKFSDWWKKGKGLEKKDLDSKINFCIRHKRRSSYTKRNFQPPSEIEVLTGSDAHRRNFVTQKFLTPGSPFAMVLTNICTVGVDLHQFCWDVVHFTPEWTPHDMEQKTGRIDRPRTELHRFQMAKNKDKVRVHHLIWPHTYDQPGVFIPLPRLDLHGKLLPIWNQSFRYRGPVS